MTDNNHNKEKPQRRQVPPWGMADHERTVIDMPEPMRLTSATPNFKYVEPGTVITTTSLRGSQILLGLFLLCFGFVPGVVYFLAASRTTQTLRFDGQRWVPVVGS